MTTRITRTIATLIAVASFAALLVATVMPAAAQQTKPGNPRTLTAKWDGANTNTPVVKLSWLAPQGNNDTTLTYGVYIHLGATDNASDSGWKQLLITSATSLSLGLRDLGLSTAQTVSFKVYSRKGDNNNSDGCVIAVATWSTTAGGDLIKFISAPVNTGKVGATYVYEAKATTRASVGDSVTLTYSIVSGPDGMKIDASTGRITWSPTAVGTYTVTIKASDSLDHSATQMFVIVVVGGGDAQGGGYVDGYVIDSTNGDAVHGATIYFIPLTSNGGTGQAMTTKADDSGHFEIKLPVGKYRVEAVRDGYNIAWWELATNADNAKVLEVTDSSMTRMVIFMFPVKALPHGTLYGTITDATTNHGIGGAKVTAVSKDSNSTAYGRQFFTETNGDGTYTLNVPAGRYVVRADASHYVGWWAGGAHEIGDAEIFTVTLDGRTEASIALTGAVSQDFCVIAGTVSGGGALLAGAKVIIAATSPDSTGISTYSVTTVTGREGSFSVSVPCGLTYVAYAVAEGYVGEYWENQTSPLDANLVKAGTDHKLAFVLEPQNPAGGAAISGVVNICDSVVSTVPAKVTAYLVGDNTLRAVSTVYTDSTGAYAFSHLGAGVYLLQAVPKERLAAPGYYSDKRTCSVDWHDATRVTVVDGTPQSGLDIYCKKVSMRHGFAHLNGHVRIKTSGPSDAFLSGGVVYAFDANGNIVDYEISDTSGTFTIDNLEAGTYVLTVDRVQYATTSQAVLTVDYGANVTQSGDITAQKETVSGVSTPSGIVPSTVMLSQNYPNPFNPTTEINFAVPVAGNVTLAVFAVTGQKVATIAGGMMAAGTYHATFDATNLPSGTYTYRLETSQGVLSHNMIELK